MKCTLPLVFASLLVVSTSGFAQLKPMPTQEDGAGLYVGGALANIGIVTDNDTLTKPKSVDGQAKVGLKLFGGYKFNEMFGAEAGYMRANDLKQSYLINGTNYTQTGNVSTFYVAGTGHLPFTNNFGLNGRLGVARTQYSGNNTLPSGITVTGSKTSPYLGVGAEYRFTPNLTGVVDLDLLTKASDSIKSGSLSAGVKFRF
jgi:OmpA-OmpF porin, OOP family